MTDGFDVRLIVDPPLDGAWNMAVDESLMRSVGCDGKDNPMLAVLRFYQWQTPTLSLGYFQRHEERRAHPASLELPLIRRSSGGGAIVHDVELTYSLTITEQAAGALFGKSNQLYVLLHEALIEALSSFRVEGQLVTELQTELERNFLCFGRRAPNDVLVAGNKVCGSAQRKKYDSISQHGSVILGTSKHAPEIIGINDMSGTDLSVDDLREQWLPSITGRLCCVPMLSTLTDTERKWAQELCEGKFATVKWNTKR